MSTSERNQRIPSGQVRWFIDRLNVSASDAMVKTMMAEKMSGTDLNARERRLVVRYALAVHHSNQRLYTAVMGGLI